MNQRNFDKEISEFYYKSLAEGKNTFLSNNRPIIYYTDKVFAEFCNYLFSKFFFIGKEVEKIIHAKEIIYHGVLIKRSPLKLLKG